MRFSWRNPSNRYSDREDEIDYRATKINAETNKLRGFISAYRNDPYRGNINKVHKRFIGDIEVGNNEITNILDKRITKSKGRIPKKIVRKLRKAFNDHPNQANLIISTVASLVVCVIFL